MKLSSYILAAVVAAGSYSAVVKAESAEPVDHPYHMQHERQFALKGMLKGLDLTDAQREQIRQLMQTGRADKAAAKPEKAAREQLHALMQAETFDEVAARQLLEQQQQAMLERQLAGMKLRHQVLQVLTDEQRAKLEARMKRQQQRGEKPQRS